MALQCFSEDQEDPLAKADFSPALLPMYWYEKAQDANLSGKLPYCDGTAPF